MRHSNAQQLRLKLFLLIALLVMFNCQPQESSSANSTPQHKSASYQHKFAYARASCAPWDGAAVQIYLSDKPSKDDQPGKPYLSMSIYKGVSQISGQTFEIGKDANIGSASLCPATGDCVRIKAGKVVIKSVTSDNKITGEYDLTFENGQHISGVFQTNEWLKLTYLCG